uniref:APC regulator of WNT signaling pathway n=1 Tax=Pavo cristatus TaxID=9049 RepID=A0A8C9FNI6_PAVCR
MAAASYDQLLKQVEALKMENSNLRQELEDNSNHLTKLETEASNMKEVLKQLQGSIEDEAIASSGQIDLLERLKELNLESTSFPGVKLRPKVSVRSYGSREGSVSSRSGECSPVPMGSFPRRGFMNGSRESTGYLEESLLLAELEKEEKEKDWYYAQLQNLTKRIDSLPLTENFSLQTDMTRRQLEYEARQIRAAMEEQLGTCQDMEKRAQVRVARIQQIEKDILRIRQLLQSQAAEAEGSAARMDHETASVMSSSNNYSVPRRLTSHLGTKVEMVYSLLSMLGTHDKDDMSRTLLAMSSSQDSCIAMRQSGCLPLLIQLLHGNDKDSVLLGNSRGSKEARARASAALHNIIHSQPDDKRGRREIRVLHLLEQIRAYCETCWEWQEAHEQGMDQDKNPMPAPVDHQICPAVCVLMKLSFDEEHRHAMNELGGLQAIAELLQVDCEMYGLTNDHYSVTLRRYAGMALTNLTFGDVANKATLCSMKGCMRALVAQLKSESEDLQQVIASVLRNLSWRADVNSKKTLREVGSVKALMECALEVKKESTLKSVLSALWNLSAHCTENKADICAVDGALAFLVGTLTYRSQTNTLAIIESGGGILRNVSSLIATNEDHRQILRENSCLQTLLQHLKSHSLTIVSNACGTLWNLSARNAKDQEALWDMGAVSMLKNLIHSKHKMIAMGSAAALRNLMANRPAKYKDANIMSPGSSLPSLHVRKQKALEAELDAQHLSETFDNIDNLSPKASHRNKQRHKQNIYSEYVLDSSRHDDGVCRTESFNTGNMTVLSPYLNSTVLPGSSSSSRGNIENCLSEKDRSLDRDRAVGLNAYHPATENSGNSSKRIGMQISTAAAQIAKVMEEVTSTHIPQEDRSSSSTSEMHSLTEDRNATRRATTAHTHSNTYFPKSENSSRPCPVPYTKMEYKRASNDSLNSVSSSDGYGKRGQMKPSIESYSEDDESKFCSYGQYPADLAHKIHSANHMDDNDGELDTPINYSLKYSDEQLNSGRQSPSQNERWARPKHIIDDEMKQNDQRQSRSQSATYPVYTESGDDKHMKYQSPFGQQDCVPSFRSRGSNGSDQNRVGSTLGINQKVNQSLCQVDDYDDDKPTNYSERYSEEEQHEEEDRPTNYSIKYNEEEHHVDQPIDYSLKYSTEVPPSSQKPSFTFSKTSSVQSTKTDHISSSSGNTSAPSAGSKRQNQLHPSSAQSRGGHAQKSASCKTPSINQETIQTYCVEDTPICFSRCSSLSSLSSAEDEIGRDQSTRVTHTNNTLQIAELKENSGALSTEAAVSEITSTSQHIRTKSSRLPTSSLSPSDSSRHKAVEFSSGAKSPSKSGAQTPKSPPEHYVQETPLMFSRCTSVSSLDSFESRSIASSVQSEPCSGMVSGIISPSDLPDSPGQTMPPSRSKTPPPAQGAQVKRDVAKGKVPSAEKREPGPRQAAVNAAVQRVQVLPDADTLLHFATESTPDGFSCSSSLSALSLDEPFIQKDVELRIMPPVHENEHGNEAEPEQSDDTKDNQEDKAEKPPEAEKDILDDSDDDDIEILEECIISAMPTKSSRKAKKPSQASAPKIPPPVARKPSQLPVYKLLPSQSRLQSQKHVSFTPGDDVPRVYCVEGTPINFSTATSLSDLTIESPPNELANVDNVGTGAESGEFEKRDTIPTEGRSTDDSQRAKSVTVTSSGLDDDKTEEGDILAECINSAMPKGKSHKPFRVKKIMDQIQQASTSLNNKNQSEGEKKKPTSPVKPVPQNIEYRARVRKNTESKSQISNERSYPENRDAKKQNLKNNSRDFNDKLPNNEDTLESKKVESESKGIKGGKRVYKSIITGKARSNSEVSSQLKQPQQTSVPSISRGRTMIHIPGVRNSSSSTSPVSKKGPPFKNTNSKSPSEGQSSASSPRGVKSSVKPEPAPVTRQLSGLNQGGSSKGPSRSGSRDSTPSRPQQQPLSRPLQSPGRNSISPGRNGISPPSKLSQLPRTSSPSTASTKSSSSGRMSYTSPGRQMSQQNLTKQTALTKNTSSIPRSESASKGLNQILGTGASNKKTDLSRMSSAKSSGSESDRSERPVLVRQSTFIKEAPSPTLRRKLEESASFESLSPSRPDSPTRSQLQTPVLSPSLPDMSLSAHSTAQTSGWRKLPPNLSPSVEYDGRPAKRHDIARSHSESPSRLPINRSGTWKREHSKHSSSLPRVSTWRRTGSSSSILSASSESSEKAKSEDEKQHGSSLSGQKQSKEGQAPAKGTWRKIKENEIPQIMNDPQHSSSSPTSSSDSKTLIYQMAPAVSKTEDVWVRIEDCPINNPRSGRSPTGNTPPVIDSVSEKGVVNGKDSKEIQEKQNPGNGSVPVRTIGLENRLNSFFQMDSPDKKGNETKPLQTNPVPAPENNESTVSERTPFSSSSSSKHSSPIGAVAARVTPFNYNPSRRKSSVDNSSARPSQIPTPVNNSTKKRDSKSENTDSSGTQSPKRHSGSYLVTSV